MKSMHSSCSYGQEKGTNTFSTLVAQERRGNLFVLFKGGVLLLCFACLFVCFLFVRFCFVFFSLFVCFCFCFFGVSFWREVVLFVYLYFFSVLFLCSFLRSFVR